MPIIKSAKKRVKVARKATVRNVKTKKTLKQAFKSFHEAVTGGKKTDEAHAKAQSALDKAGNKGVMHKNKVARKKRQLAAQAKAASGGKKATAPKAAAKKKTTAKPAAKIASPAKKTTTAKKTTAAKKPVSKKAPAKKTTK
jgi:ribosomal protein S20